MGLRKRGALLEIKLQTLKLVLVSKSLLARELLREQLDFAENTASCKFGIVVKSA